MSKTTKHKKGQDWLTITVDEESQEIRLSLEPGLISIIPGDAYVKNNVDMDFYVKHAVFNLLLNMHLEDFGLQITPVESTESVDKFIEGAIERVKKIRLESFTVKKGV